MTDALVATYCPTTPNANPSHLEPAGACSTSASLIRASIAPNTHKTYQGALGRLDAWLGVRPLDDDALSEWIAHLHDQGLSTATAAMAVAAARFRAKLAADKDPAGPLTRRTLAGIRRSSRDRGRGQVAGVPWEEADAVVDRAAREGTLRGMRDAALIAVASDALLRVSEMVTIDVRDIERDPDGSAVLHVRFSKTDQEGRGATCYLGCRTVAVLDAWLDSADIGHDGEEAVFRSVRKGGTVAGRLSVRSARAIVTARCGGRDRDRVSGHSLRVGSALSLARAGASLVELQQAGRWKSPDMPARYTRGETARRGAVARLRHGREAGRRQEADEGRVAGSVPESGPVPQFRFNGARKGISVFLGEMRLADDPPKARESAPGWKTERYRPGGPMSNSLAVSGTGAPAW